jgi:hypothetical protein
MLKVVKAYEDSQAAAERLVAQEASPVVYVFSMFRKERRMQFLQNLF